MIDSRLTPSFFEKNRRNFIAEMDGRSVAVFHAATPVINSVDQFHRYRQTSEFFFFTGIKQPGCVLMLYPEDEKGQTETLFIPKPDPSREVWDGKMLDKEAAEEINGFDAKSIQWEKDFEGAFLRAQQYADVLYADYDDMGLRFSTSRNMQFLQDVQSNLPGLHIARASQITHNLRKKKSPEEIQVIEKAIDITGEALTDIWKHTKPGVSEYELEALLAYHFIINGARRYAYEPIIAAGLNAATLHYINNESRLEDGDVLLTDVGAEYSHYCADITRTVPVNGKFTDRQRNIYTAVLDVQKNLIEMIEPGVVMKDLNDQAKDMIGDKLLALELIGDKEETSKYYMHSIGHFLGLDTHDVGSTKQPLEPGNILTVEPGIYIQEEKIGVRIEDNILVTEDGCRNLSADIPKEIEEVENAVR